MYKRKRKNIGENGLSLHTREFGREVQCEMSFIHVNLPE